MHSGTFDIKTQRDRERKAVSGADTLCTVAPLIITKRRDRERKTASGADTL